MKNYYSVLGLSDYSSLSDIKSAYRSLAKKYHPDLQSGASEELKELASSHLREIIEAYSFLIKNKNQYDIDLRQYLSPPQKKPPRPDNARTTSRDYAGKTTHCVRPSRTKSGLLMYVETQAAGGQFLLSFPLLVMVNSVIFLIREVIDKKRIFSFVSFMMFVAGIYFLLFDISLFPQQKYNHIELVYLVQDIYKIIILSIFSIPLLSSFVISINPKSFN